MCISGTDSLLPCSRSYSRQKSAQRLCRDSTILCETKVGSSSLQNTTATDLARHISNARSAGLLLPSCGTTMLNLRKSCFLKTSSASRLPAAISLQTLQTCKTSQMCTLARWGFNMLLLCCTFKPFMANMQLIANAFAASSMLKHIAHNAYMSIWSHDVVYTKVLTLAACGQPFLKWQ